MAETRRKHEAAAIKLQQAAADPDGPLYGSDLVPLIDDVTTDYLAAQPADDSRAEINRLMDALEIAWGVIANAHGGNWDHGTGEWQKAAERWRDEHWHPALDRNGYTTIGREDATAQPTDLGKVMPTELNQQAWEQLIDEDIAWVEQQPRTLERDHITQCLEWLREHKPALAAQPADDEQLIDAEWLESVGWKYSGGYLSFHELYYDHMNTTPTPGMHCPARWLPHIKTRGDVRWLCAALGVELKEERLRVRNKPAWRKQRLADKKPAG